MIDYINKKLGSNMVSIGLTPKHNKAKSIIAFGYIHDTTKEEKKS